MRKISDFVGADKNVHFKFYRDNNLWYETECGFQFPVPTDDIGNASFNATEKSIMMMRYIRKFLEAMPD